MQVEAKHRVTGAGFIDLEISMQVTLLPLLHCSAACTWHRS